MPFRVWEQSKSAYKCSQKAPKGKQPLRAWVKADRNRQMESSYLTIEGKSAGLTPQSVCKGCMKHVGGGNQVSASLYVMVREGNVWDLTPVGGGIIGEHGYEWYRSKAIEKPYPVV